MESQDTCGSDLRVGYEEESRGAREEGSPPPEFLLPRISRDPDTHSLHSENSFKTCSSEPQLNLIPRAVSENYSASNERSAQERKASVRALKHQYSARANNNGALIQKHNLADNKSVR